MTTISFQRVAIKGVRRWKENGKPRQKTMTFEQTINPFNKDKDGFPKTREQIMHELKRERDRWESEVERGQ